MGADPEDSRAPDAVPDGMAEPLRPALPLGFSVWGAPEHLLWLKLAESGLCSWLPNHLGLYDLVRDLRGLEVPDQEEGGPAWLSWRKGFLGGSALGLCLKGPGEFNQLKGRCFDFFCLSLPLFLGLLLVLSVFFPVSTSLSHWSKAWLSWTVGQRSLPRLTLSPPS